MAWRRDRTCVFEKSIFQEKVSALFFAHFESAVLNECPSWFRSDYENETLPVPRCFVISGLCRGPPGGPEPRCFESRVLAIIALLLKRAGKKSSEKKGAEKSKEELKMDSEL